MIDLFIIFTKTGLVLFSHKLSEIKGDPVDAFIKTVLLEERKGETTFTHESYAVRWNIRNDVGLIFAAVYHHMLTPPYVTDLLDAVSKVRPTCSSITTQQLDSHCRRVTFINQAIKIKTILCSSLLTCCAARVACVFAELRRRVQRCIGKCLVSQCPLCIPRKFGRIAVLNTICTFRIGPWEHSS
jgi:hypothetical protein